MATEKEVPEHWADLMLVEKGQKVSITVDDFCEDQLQRDENPQTLKGEVTKIEEDISRSEGEIVRVVTVGDPSQTGFLIDLGDTEENTEGGGEEEDHKYTKAWRPKPGRGRDLMGEVTALEMLSETYPW